MVIFVSMDTVITTSDAVENTLKSEVRSLFEQENMTLIALENSGDEPDSWPTFVSKSRIHLLLCGRQCGV